MEPIVTLNENVAVTDDYNDREALDIYVDDLIDATLVNKESKQSKLNTAKRLFSRCMKQDMM